MIEKFLAQDADLLTGGVFEATTLLVPGSWLTEN